MGGGFNGENSKFRTYNLTVVAIHTGLRLFDRGRVVTFTIEVGRKTEDLTGTKLYTVSASFTTIFKYVNDTGRDLVIFEIKWNPP